MQTVVEKMINKTYSNDDLRYYVHSSHDTQIWNVLEFLQPLNYDPTDVPYASTIFFEIHYDETCMSNPKTRGSQCFTVHILNNGLILKFDTCLQDNNMNSRFGSPICSYDAFIRHWNKIRYQEEDVDQKCKTSFKPNGLQSLSRNTFL